MVAKKMAKTVYEREAGSDSRQPETVDFAKFGSAFG